jgi:hypothetical protein
MTEVVSLHQSEEDPGYCLTPTVRGITGLLDNCHQHSLLGVVIGEPGTGKSTAIEAYVKDHDNAILCRMTKTTGGIQPMLVRLWQCVGGQMLNHAGAPELYEKILDELKRPYFEPLLIVDEAQQLSDEALEGLRDLYDEAKIGLVLVGNEQLSSRWSTPQTKSAKSHAKYRYFAPLRGRIGRPLEIRKPLKQDIQALCDYHKIEGREARKLMEIVASEPGYLHNVNNLLRVAKGLASSDSRLTLCNLKDAAQLTGALG